MKTAIMVLLMLLTSAQADTSSELLVALPLQKVTIMAERIKEGISVKVTPRNSFKWSKEYPAKLSVSSLAPWVKADQVFERTHFTMKDFKVVGKNLVEVSVDMKTVDPALLADTDVLIKVKFAVCNETSCYPQKAELIVSL